MSCFILLYPGGPLILPGTTPDEDVQVGVLWWAANCDDGESFYLSVSFLRFPVVALSFVSPLLVFEDSCDTSQHSP